MGASGYITVHFMFLCVEVKIKGTIASLPTLQTFPFVYSFAPESDNANFVYIFNMTV